MAETKYAIIQWNDKFTSVVNLDNIKLPRKPIHQYMEGDFITALFGKKPYRARISEISDDRSVLMAKKGKNGVFPLKFPYEENMDPELAAEEVVNLSQEADSDRNNTSIDKERDTVISTNEGMDIQPVIIEEMEVQSAVIEEPDTITTQEEMNIQPIRKEQDQGEEQHSNLKKDISNLRSSGSRRLEKRVDHLEREVKDLRSSLKSLKRKFSELSGTIQDRNSATTDDTSSSSSTTLTSVSTSSATSSSTFTVDNLLKSVSHIGNSEKDINECVRRITLTVFSRQDLVSCSRTGKKTFHSPGKARPPLDPERLKLVEQVLLLKCSISRETFIKKFDNLVKMERRSSKTCSEPIV